MVFGHHVIWFNMASNPEKVDQKIMRYLESGDATCWDSSSLMFMRKKPPEVTRDLLEAAIFAKDAKAVRRLNDVLRRPFQEAVDGFDGIIVYSDRNGQRFHSLTAGTSRFESVYSLSTNMAETLCLVMPDIVRKT